MKLLPRRDFLARMALLAGGATYAATQSRFSLIQSALAASSRYADIEDYKSLVCVFLFGGNDSLNMWVPYPQAQYDNYAALRQALAIPRSQLLPVSGNEYAFHQNMPAMRDLYNAGQLAIVSNVGNLIEPTTRETYQNESVRLPPDLFSHSHQTDMWQTNLPSDVFSTSTGWGGRMGDLLAEANSNPAIPPTFTLTGSNLWQAAENQQAFSVNPFGSVQGFEFFSDAEYPPWAQSRTVARETAIDRPFRNLLASQLAGFSQDAVARVAEIKTALDGAPEIATPFTQNSFLARQLQMAARLISVRESLGMKRQIIFVGLGSFDTHSNQISDHEVLLKDLDDALNSFYLATQELSVADSVVTFTASEFGRTLTSNGDGTDHAWGGDQMVIGDAIDGGKVFGEPAVLAIAGPDDTDDAGRFIPKLAVDQYGATLANWMGISAGDSLDIFPNLQNFSGHDIGFIA